MDPMVVKAWLDVIEEALGLASTVALIIAVFVFTYYVIKHPD